LKGKKPLVSIIVRTKDRPTLLKKALGSVSGQTYRPLEVVLVNDGGYELDSEEVKNILGDIPLNYIRLEKNMGRAHAGNIGIKHSKGKYIGFLDDDDEYFPDHIPTLVPLLEQLDYKVAYADSIMVYKEYDSELREVTDREEKIMFSRDFDYDFLLFENYIPFMCLLFKKEILTEAGGLDEGLDLYEDWDLLIRLGEKYPFFHIKKATARYNQWASDMQISQQNKDSGFVDQSYMKVFSKHRDKITDKRIRAYVSGFVGVRSRLQELDAHKEHLELALKGRNDRIRGLENAVANLESMQKERDARIAERDAAILERDTAIANHNAAIAERDTAIANHNAAILERDTAIANHNAAILERDTAIANHNAAILERDTAIANHNAAILERDTAIANHSAAIAERDAAIVELNAAVTEHNAAIELQRAEIAKHMSSIEQLRSGVENLQHEVKNRDLRTEELERALKDKESRIWDLEIAFRDRDTSLQTIYNSRGWKALLVYYRFREKIFPPNSKRRLFAKLCLIALKDPKGFLKSLNMQNIRKFFLQYKVLDPSVIEGKVKKKTSVHRGNESPVDNPTPRQAAACDNKVPVPDQTVPGVSLNPTSVLLIGEWGLNTEGNTPDWKSSFINQLGNLDYTVSQMNNEETAEEYFRNNGAGFSFIIGSDTDLCYDLFPLVRAYAPQSRLLYAALSTNSGNSTTELVNALVSDLVIVDSDDKKIKLMDRDGALNIEVIHAGENMQPAVGRVLAAIREKGPAKKDTLETAEGSSTGMKKAAHVSAQDNGEPEYAGSGAVLVAGIYLSNRKNSIEHIVGELNKSKKFRVVQRWAALGGEAPSEKVDAVTVLKLKESTPKMMLLNRILSEQDMGNYDYLIICDDDIILPDNFLDDFLALQGRYNYAAAQPARTHNSYIDHFIVEQMDGLKARRTRFVEIGPLISFRRDFIPFVFPFDQSTPMGWGFDYVLPCIAEKHGLRVGIIDATPVDHSLRKPMQYYEYSDAKTAMDAYLSANPHLSREEAFTILESCS
jgi:glycosyltransferase involved in cell wall biosynthesis